MGATSEVAVGLLHPGTMGAAMGRVLRDRGVEVWWASAGRSAETRARAGAAGLTDAGTPARLVQRCDVVLSICPPDAAVEVAGTVAGFEGVYVDANAIAPATAHRIAEIVSPRAAMVDGGIIGQPPATSGGTRLYLSGQRAPEVRELFAGTSVEARAVDGGVGAASAVKMAYSAWTKGSAALLLTARDLAAAEGVEAALIGEWADSRPALVSRLRQAEASAVEKGWRWIGEMEEIAASMAANGLPDGFHHAAAEVFRRSAANGTVPSDRPPTPPEAAGGRRGR